MKKRKCNEEQLMQVWKKNTCYCSPTPSSKASSQNISDSIIATLNVTATKTMGAPLQHSTNHIQISVAVFSATVCLLITILAFVTIGWAWTCWIMKKKERFSSCTSKYICAIVYHREDG